MRTISKMAKGKLSELLGDYEELGFSLVIGNYSLLLQFKDTVLHSFKQYKETPITAECVQDVCRQFLNELNTQN